MDNWQNDLSQKLRELQDFAQSEEIKDILGIEATNYFKESFENEGFTDENLEKWKDVKRRDESSGWYGHSGQTGRFSAARSSAKILSGETGELRNSMYYKHTDRGVRITNPTAYARVHQFGMQAKIYGKKAFQMIARPFMGKSKLLVQNIQEKIKQEFMKILSK